MILERISNKIGNTYDRNDMGRVTIAFESLVFIFNCKTHQIIVSGTSIVYTHVGLSISTCIILKCFYNYHLPMLYLYLMVVYSYVLQYQYPVVTLNVCVLL